LIYIGFPMQFQHLGGLQADLMGGSGGADAPPGIKLGFVFWQPRDSRPGLAAGVHVSRKIQDEPRILKHR
jgi:hypothetical protein